MLEESDFLILFQNTFKYVKYVNIYSQCLLIINVKILKLLIEQGFPFLSTIDLARP